MQDLQLNVIICVPARMQRRNYTKVAAPIPRRVLPCVRLFCRCNNFGQSNGDNRHYRISDIPAPGIAIMAILRACGRLPQLLTIACKSAENSSVLVTCAAPGAAHELPVGRKLLLLQLVTKVWGWLSKPVIRVRFPCPLLF